MDFKLERGEQSRLARDANYSQQMMSGILDGSRRTLWAGAKRCGKVSNTDTDLWMEGTPKQIMEGIIDGGRYKFKGG